MQEVCRKIFERAEKDDSAPLSLSALPHCHSEPFPTVILSVAKNLALHLSVRLIRFFGLCPQNDMG